MIYTKLLKQCSNIKYHTYPLAKQFCQYYNKKKTKELEQGESFGKSVIPVKWAKYDIYDLSALGPL